MHALLRPSRWHGSEVVADAIREIVFGAEDGTVQNTALIAGMVGAAVSNHVIVIAGLVNAIAGVLSMAAGTYLSSKAERDAHLATGVTDPRRYAPGRDALVMGIAYACGALVPILPFAVGFAPHVAIRIAVVATGLVLFGLGAGKAIVSRQSILRSGLEMLLVAAAAGLAGYLIGVAAGAVFGVEA